MLFLKKILLLATLLGSLTTVSAAVVFPGSTPGPSNADQSSGSVSLSNNLLTAKFINKNGTISFGGLSSKEGPIAKAGGELFIINLDNGESIKSSELKARDFKVVNLPANPKAFKLADRFPGKSITANFQALNGTLRISWRAVLRHSSHYLRQEIKLVSTQPVPMKNIVAMQYQLDEDKGGKPSISGNARGALIINDLAFAALETPMGINTVSDSQLAEGLWSRKTTLNPKEIWDVSSVLGVFAPDQQRRSFLAYIERERVMPYRPFVHYNSWYELNINRNNDSDPSKRMTEAQSMAVLKDWQEKFFDKRGIAIDAFVWDDGWDEFNSLWDFHKMYPQGFKNVDAAARKQKAGIGAWLGPVGGYGTAKAKRIAHWNMKHPENKIDNFQLSNKEYFDAFLNRCSQMVKDYNMKYFKFDGISTNFHSKGPGNEEDAEGIIRVLETLRKQKGDLYLNCTVGTWASPFWFRYADSVWRQENDFGTTGQGDSRDQWITYRDRLVHEVFVEGSPLMPINSMMTHGLMVTKFGPPACMSKDPENVKKELRCAMACGTSLQELYVDRDLMNANNEALWDELAQGIKWIRRNADVLDDVHWVGGNPWNKDTKEGSVYGWAAWNKDKATLALRNSSEQEKSLTGTLRSILDIPKNFKGTITLKDSYDDQRALPGFSGVPVDIDKELTLTIKPFEVLVYEGGAVQKAQ